MTSENTVIPHRAVDAADARRQSSLKLPWRPGGRGVYYAQAGVPPFAAEVGRSGSAKWYVKVWPVALTPCPAGYIQHEVGLRTMADARAMVLGMPCFRCGLGQPLILMERYAARFRCTDHAACEAERARLLDRGRA